MKPVFFVLLISLLIQSASAQLLPSISNGPEPEDTTAICTIPWYLGSFDNSGYQNGDFVPDFTLYDTQGGSFTLSDKLTTGKPVVLISGSLTCPVFRNRIATINSMMSAYAGLIETAVIYTVEAHPTDTSPYFGYINTGNANISSGITFPQPVTYGDRKILADTLSYWVNCQAPIYLDDPCNTWWSQFGPAPNNAYIITPNGQVFSKHSWFNKSPKNIYCDLDSLLGTNSGQCTSAPGNGIFTLSVLNNSSMGNPGDILYNFCWLVNPSPSPVSIGIKKLISNVPSGWLTAFCADICYSPTEDSITVSLQPGDSILFSLDFITSALPDSGSVRVGFRNVQNSSNGTSLWMRASTLTVSGISETVVDENRLLYPNPSSDYLHVIEAGQNQPVLMTTDGRALESNTVSTDRGWIVDIRSLKQGSYLLRTEKHLYRFVKN